jgi:hypothetical protein
MSTMKRCSPIPSGAGPSSTLTSANASSCTHTRSALPNAKTLCLLANYLASSASGCLRFLSMSVFPGAATRVRYVMRLARASG